MVDRYYREIEDVENDIENAMQISSILLKLKGYDNELSKIGHNENNISSNLSKIEDNKTNISTNLSNIEDNETNISLNLEKINDNDSNIDEIRSNLNNIKNDLSDFKINYSIQNLFLFDINIEQNYTLNKDNPEFNIFSYNLEDDFKSNVILEFNCKILYNYNSYNSIGHLTHIYKLYDENNKLIYEYQCLKSNAGDNLSAYLNQNDLFYAKLNNNYTIIKIKLFLSIIDKNKKVTCKLLNTFKSNFLVVKHYKKINTLSVNNNLTNLKNVYNIKYYDYKKEIKFNESFFNKKFNLNLKKNDFIDVDIKMKLEYEDIDDSKIINTSIILYNDMDEEIFILNFNNKDSISYSNFVLLNENILYNFIEDTEFFKIIIKFEFLQVKSIKKVHYIPSNNDRLYLKHYTN